MDIKSAKTSGKLDQALFYAVLRKLKYRQGEGQNPWKSLQAVLSDGTGEINAAPVYGNDPLYSLLEKIPEGSHVRIEGSLSEYQGDMQVRIMTVRAAQSSDDDYDPVKLIKATSLNIEEMFNYAVERAETISAKDIRELTLKLVQDYADELKSSPASVEIHHPYLGGLLEHLWRMLKIHEGMEELYAFTDRDVVVAGIILHDIGKISEYSLKRGGTPAVTDAGELFGHIYMGAAMIQNEALNNQTAELSVQMKNLLHVVLSHHGKREYGSPQPPKTAEAWLVHLIDYLESRMQIVSEEIEKIKPGKWSQQKIWPLENVRLANLGRKDE